MAIERSQAERVGLMLMMVESVIYGLYPVFTRGLVRGADPILVAAVSSIFASLPFLVDLKRRRQLWMLFAPQFVGKLVLIGLLATGIANLFFFVGTARSSAINASLLVQLEPIYSLFLATIFLKESISRKQVAATCLLLLGAVFVLFQDGFTLQAGDILLGLTPLWYQLGHLVAKKFINDVPTVSLIAGGRLLFGGLFLLIVALSMDPQQSEQLKDWEFLTKMLLFGVLIVGLEKLIWYEAIKRIDLGKASALLVPSVAVSVLGAWLILDESLRYQQFIGMFLIFCGLALIASSNLVSSPEKAEGHQG